MVQKLGLGGAKARVSKIPCDVIQYMAIEERLIEILKVNVITNMSLNSHRALTLLHSRSHELGIEVVSWHQNAYEDM